MKLVKERETTSSTEMAKRRRKSTERSKVKTKETKRKKKIVDEMLKWGILRQLQLHNRCSI